MAPEKKKEITDYLLSHNLIEECVKYQTLKYKEFDNIEDLVQDTWLWILSYDENKLEDAYDNKHLNALITRYLSNNLFSKSSPYWSKYKKFRERTDEITQEALQVPDY